MPIVSALAESRGLTVGPCRGMGTFKQSYGPFSIWDELECVGAPGGIHSFSPLAGGRGMFVSGL